MQCSLKLGVEYTCICMKMWLGNDSRMWIRGVHERERLRKRTRWDSPFNLKLTPYRWITLVHVSLASARHAVVFGVWWDIVISFLFLCFRLVYCANCYLVTTWLSHNCWYTVWQVFVDYNIVPRGEIYYFIFLLYYL